MYGIVDRQPIATETTIDHWSAVAIVMLGMV